MSPRLKATVAACALLALAVAVSAVPTGASAEQSSQPSSVRAGGLDLGRYHSCALLPTSSVRCWGYAGDGALGYANRLAIGDDETPADAGPVDLGAGRTAKAIAAGSVFTCALLDNGQVRCWGFGGDGRLGYANTDNIGDDETPGSVGPVDLGAGRTAVAITAGRAHTCAILDDGNVRCWGFGFDGRLGYGNNIPNDNNNVGDDETPGSVAPVQLGAGRTAVAITAGDSHTCAILDNGSVRCWGYAADGQLGYGNKAPIGDDETPASAGPVNLGSGRTAVAIAAGDFHTCAVLDNATVRCWGYGGTGRLGYENASSIGDDETPDAAGPVNLGGPAKAITAGNAHTCALLDDNTVRCWGYGLNGQLGYANTDTIGDNEPPASAGPVSLGAGRTATAISAAGDHTCARLDAGISVRCWGRGINGEVGYCDRATIGDDETPGSAGPVNLGSGEAAGGACVPSFVVKQPAPPPPPPPVAEPGGTLATPEPSTPASPDDGLRDQASRVKGLRDCRTDVLKQARRQRAAVKKRYSRRRPHERSLGLHKVEIRAAAGRARCVMRFARTPGRVVTLAGRAASSSSIVLSFRASGTDGSRPPAARGYLVKQSLRPIRTLQEFERASALCKGVCSFAVTLVNTPVILKVIDLRPHTTYYYALAARDNVTNRKGPRSTTIAVKTK